VAALPMSLDLPIVFNAEFTDLPHPDEIEVCGFAAESVIKIEDKPFHWCPLHTLTSFTLLERGAFLPCPCMYTI
jgi:hypothetical protein